MWVGVSYLLSRLGWSSLAARYHSQAVPEGERIRWVSAQLGGVSFRACLNLTLGPAGLHLVPMLPFRLFLPPVLIPWTDIRFGGFARIPFNRIACFRIGGPDGIVFAVHLGPAAQIQAFLPKADKRDFDTERLFEGRLIDRRLWLVAVAAAVVGLIAALLASKR